MNNAYDDVLQKMAYIVDEGREEDNFRPSSLKNVKLEVFLCMFAWYRFLYFPFIILLLWGNRYLFSSENTISLIHWQVADNLYHDINMKELFPQGKWSSRKSKAFSAIGENKIEVGFVPQD